ncbi:unnamed protein product [Adineta ricciae]|uniref:Uncharacterized protein n=1 Tax=Adineta ricciae TaxID=249248 RepID=A0A815NFG8_ADIRI|nr:unnamed protein product [Adineta ricciae]
MENLHPMTKFIPVVHYLFIREGLKVIYKNEASEFIPWEIFHAGLIVIDYVKENDKITCEFRFDPTSLLFLFTYGPKGFSGVFNQDFFMKNNHELLSEKIDEPIPRSTNPIGSYRMRPFDKIRSNSWKRNCIGIRLEKTHRLLQIL